MYSYLYLEFLSSEYFLVVAGSTCRTTFVLYSVVSLVDKKKFMCNFEKNIYLVVYRMDHRRVRRYGEKSG